MKKQPASSPDNNSALRPRRVVQWLLSITLLILCAVAVSAAFARFKATAQQPEKQQQENQAISPQAERQITALMAEKAARTPEQNKISSQLLYAVKMNRGEKIAEGVPTLEVSTQTDSDGKTVVDITGEIGGMLLEKLEEHGAEILTVVPSYQSIRARVSLDKVEEIAALSEVKYIQPKQEAQTHLSLKPTTATAGRRRSQYLAPDFADRADRVRAYLSKAMPKLSTSLVAAPVSEGDVVHKADVARKTFGMNGTGLKIGVLSDGVTSLRISQALGALGAVTVLPGQTGGGDEGTAMLEIIHALAPGAQLYFATAFNGIGSFADNIRKLRAAGCDVIVDDVFYFAESVFQDGQPILQSTQTNGGVVTQAVNDVTASGALYFSSAGNQGSLTKGTSSVWEGDFKDGGAGTAPLAGAGRIHDFGGGQLFDIAASATSPITLQWSDPLGASSNDYDLYVLNSTGSQVMTASTGAQNGTQDPFEIVGSQPAGRRIVIARFAGEKRYLNLDTFGGRLTIATNGQTHGHSSAANAFSVAAAPAFFPLGAPPNPVGPFPNPFTTANKVELFTSDGPRRLFFKPDGSPYTPGSFTASGGIVRQKPDITAADGTSVTGVGGFGGTFFGTSAAAPHAAAIAALLKSANPAFTNAQIRAALISTALDIEAPGTDIISGAGIITALESAQALGVSPMADLDLGNVTATETSGNGNGLIEPGETAQLKIQLKNFGVLGATGITARLTSATPGVFVADPGTSTYPAITAQTGAAVNDTPFTFRLSTVAPCDLDVFFNLTVTYTGGPSPKVFQINLRTGAPPITIASTLDTTAPTAGPNFKTATGLQSARLTRSGIPSACDTTKAFPGVFSTGTRQFDAYTFETCPGTAPSCITVAMNNSVTSGTQSLFAAAYEDNFDPNNLAANYLGDIGFSPLPGESLNFSFNVKGGKKFVIVVNEVNSGGGIGINYSLNISGLCLACSANLICLQDDHTRDFLLFNVVTGDYLYNRCADDTILAGRGLIGRATGHLTLRDGYRINALINLSLFGSSRGGSASIKLTPLGSSFSLRDSNLINSTCACP